MRTPVLSIQTFALDISPSFLRFPMAVHLTGQGSVPVTFKG